jgi:pSer/pThr/pTyr-binding forkhead associated (FHA) protein
VLQAVWAEITRPAAVAAAAAVGGGRATDTRPPPAGPIGHVKIVEPPEQRGRTFEVGDEMTVGRAEGCAIALDDKTASQLHARLFRRDGRLFVEDLGSTNGTYLNAKPVSSPVALRIRDRLTIGRTVLEVTK